MKKIKVIGSICCMMFLSAAISGCSKSTALDDTSIYVRKDGSLASAVYETFDTNKYDKDDLTEFIENAVCAYNQSSMGTAAAYTKKTDDKLNIAIDSIDFKSDKAVLTMEYASCDDYLSFNESEGKIDQMASGTIKGAKKAGIDFDKVNLKSVDGGDCNINDVDDSSGILFIEGNAEIKVDGKIMYKTEDVKVNGDDAASVASDDEISCIIFK